MNNKRFSFFSLLSLAVLSINPVFAEVISLQTNNDSFMMGEKIKFSGTVDKKSAGLVTIVIRDQNNEFVLLTQSTINHDDTFERILNVDNEFTQNGTYIATGFILNMTKGIPSEFNVMLNDNGTDQENILENAENEIIKNEQNYDVKNLEEQIPDEKVKNEIIPEVQSLSIVETKQSKENNSDIAEISLALGVLAILFGAVYGIKRQVDSNSRQISINKDSIRKKYSFHKRI
jgi:flagellar biogenesis protein FliO